MGARALVVAACILGAGCLADFALLWPPPRNPNAVPGRMLPDPGGAVEVFVTPPGDGEPPDLYVIAMFGNGEEAEAPAGELIAMFHRAGLRAEVWGVNYAGYGYSAGRASLGGVARSARRAYAEVAGRAAGKPIVVYGSSMGTTAALHLAATVRLAGAVLKNAPPLPELVLRRFGWWNLFLLALPIALQIPEDLDSIGNAEHATAPALFLSATADHVVPDSYQDRVMAAYAGPWRVIHLPGAGHNDPLSSDAERAMVAAIRRWATGGAAAAAAAPAVTPRRAPAPRP